MAATKKRAGVSLNQFVALIVVTIVISLMVDFGRKVALHRRLQAEEARLDRAVEYEEDRGEYLEWLRGYVQSEQFVDAWARREWKMVKPGETSVVPVLLEAPSAPQALPQEESQPSDEVNWQEWWKRYSGG
jgi:cell division protein FtsB